MSVMGINFSKMLATKEKGARGKINIANNITITGVEKVKLVLGTKDQDTLKFTFSYVSKYEPNVGKIEFEGEVIYLAKKEDAEKILADFDKTKKVEGPVKIVILNSIVNKCTIQALILSKDMNLPAPVPLPKVNGGEKKAPAKTEKKTEKADKKE